MITDIYSLETSRKIFPLHGTLGSATTKHSTPAWSMLCHSGVRRRGRHRGHAAVGRQGGEQGRPHGDPGSPQALVQVLRRPGGEAGEAGRAAQEGDGCARQVHATAGGGRAEEEAVLRLD